MAESPAKSLADHMQSKSISPAKATTSYIAQNAKPVGYNMQEKPNKPDHNGFQNLNPMILISKIVMLTVQQRILETQANFIIYIYIYVTTFY